VYFGPGFIACLDLLVGGFNGLCFPPLDTFVYPFAGPCFLPEPDFLPDGLGEPLVD
jgi:hypothetical protein